MAKEIAFENGWISNFEELVTLSDLGSGHTAYIVHHSSTSTYMPNVTEIKETFCGRTDVRIFETGCIKLTLSKSGPKKL